MTEAYAIEDFHRTCPYCAEPVHLIVDLSAGSSRYVEDCEVCCQPITVILEVSASAQIRLDLKHEDEA